MELFLKLEWIAPVNGIAAILVKSDYQTRTILKHFIMILKYKPLLCYVKIAAAMIKKLLVHLPIILTR